MHPKILALRRPIAVYKSIYCLSALLFFLELGIQSIYLANSVLFELGMIFADCPIAKCDDGYHCFIIVKSKKPHRLFFLLNSCISFFPECCSQNVARRSQIPLLFGMSLHSITFNASGELYTSFNGVLCSVILNSSFNCTTFMISFSLSSNHITCIALFGSIGE